MSKSSGAEGAAIVAIAAGIVYAAFARHVVGFTGPPLDDGFIHLQFARNLAAGSGMSYFGGELVGGSTAPLWTLLLAVLSGLPGPALVWAQAFGLLCFAASVFQTVGLARDLGVDPLLARFAGYLAATTGPLVWASVSGLEIPLFALLSLAAIRRHLHDRQRSDGVAFSLPLFALAVLARPEGALLLALAVIDRLAVQRFRPRAAVRSLGPGLLLAGLLLAPVALFHLLSGGSLLPTTFAAKGAGWHRLTPDLRYLHTVIGIFLRAQPVAALFAIGGLLELLRRDSIVPDAGRAALPALWCVGLPFVYSLLSAPGPAMVGNFGRYYYPLLPLVVVFGCLGLTPLLRRLRVAQGWAASRWVVLLLALLVAAPALHRLGLTAGRFAQNVRNVHDGDVAAARWLGERLPPEATLAVNDVGALQYLLPQNRVLDLAGLVTPRLTAYTRLALESGRPRNDGVTAYLAEARPDYLVIFPEWFPMLISSDVRYRPVREFAVPGNITLGGSRVVVFRTPWTDVELEP